MLNLFEDGLLLSEIRASKGGHKLVLETIKFIVVVFIADKIVDAGIGFVIRHNIEPFASMPSLGLIVIGFLSLISLAYLLIWENMRPRHAGIRFLPAGKSFAHFGLGYAIGAAVMSASVLLATLVGGFKLTPNITQAIPAEIALIALIYVFQAFGEEVLYRGTCMTCIARKNHAIWAIVISSLLFSLHHHFNGGYGPVAFVNLFLLGVLLAITVLWSNRIWVATALHAAWNFFQGNVFGVNVSGSEPSLTGTIFSCTAQDMPLVTGGQMGLEGSIITTAVLVVALAVVIWVYIKRRNISAQDAAAEKEA